MEERWPWKGLAGETFEEVPGKSCIVRNVEEERQVVEVNKSMVTEEDEFTAEVLRVRVRRLERDVGVRVSGILEELATGEAPEAVARNLAEFQKVGRSTVMSVVDEDEEGFDVVVQLAGVEGAGGEDVWREDGDQNRPSCKGIGKQCGV